MEIKYGNGHFCHSLATTPFQRTMYSGLATSIEKMGKKFGVILGVFAESIKRAINFV